MMLCVLHVCANGQRKRQRQSAEHKVFEVLVKISDRLKALEKLASMGGGENSESSFIKALSEGARLLSEEEDI